MLGHGTRPNTFATWKNRCPGRSTTSLTILVKETAQASGPTSQLRVVTAQAHASVTKINKNHLNFRFTYYALLLHWKTIGDSLSLTVKLVVLTEAEVTQLSIIRLSTSQSSNKSNKCSKLQIKGHTHDWTTPFCTSFISWLYRGWDP